MVISSVSYLMLFLLIFALLRKNKLSNILLLSIILSVLYSAAYLDNSSIILWVPFGFFFICGSCYLVFKHGLSIDIINIYSPLIILITYSILMTFLLPFIFNGLNLDLSYPYTVGITSSGQLLGTRFFFEFGIRNAIFIFSLLFHFLFCFMISYLLELGKIKISKIYDFFIYAMLVVLIFGIYNFCYIYIFNSLPWPLHFLFNSSIGYINQTYGINATFLEPAFFARYSSGCLFGLYNVINIKYFLKKPRFKEECIFFCCLFLAIFCRSSTSILCLGVLFLYVLATSIRSNNYKYILIVVSIIALVISIYFIFPGFRSWFDERLFNKLNTYSGLERGLWNKNSLNIFLQSNFFGIGLGYFRASSFLYNVLSNFGLLGIILICFFVLKITHLRKVIKNKIGSIPFEIIFFEGFLLGSCIGWFISTAGYFYPSIWISLGAIIGGYLYLLRPIADKIKLSSVAFSR